MRSPVNRRDPSGTRKIEREEIARQREIISRYIEAMAEIAVGDRPDKAQVLGRLSEGLKDDLSASADDWMANAEKATVRVTDKVLNNLNTGIVLGNAVRVPEEELRMLSANIRANVRSVGDDLLKEFESQLGVGLNATTPDGLFSVEAVRCLGCCGLAPVCVVNGNVHGKLEKKDVAGIIEQYRKQG